MHTLTIIEMTARKWFLESGFVMPKHCPLPTWEGQPESIKNVWRKKADVWLTSILKPDNIA
jgi:hypothetical protein